MSTTDLLLLAIPAVAVVVFAAAVCIVRVGHSRRDARAPGGRSEQLGYTTSFGRRLSDRDRS